MYADVVLKGGISSYMEEERSNREKLWTDHTEHMVPGYSEEWIKRIIEENTILRRRCQRFFEESPSGYVVMEPDGLIRNMNAAFCRMFSSSEPERGHYFSEYVLPAYQEPFQSLLSGVREDGRRRALELGLKGSSGSEPLYVMLCCNLCPDPEPIFSPGGVPLIRCSAVDVSELKHKQSEFFYDSTHDPLTGIYNRRYYDEQLKEVDQPASLPLSVGMIDLDGLKMINDSLGHQFGDQAIKTVVEVIKKMAAPKDVLIRLGGDEFLLLFPGTELHEAGNFLHEAEARVKARILSGIPLTFSWGAATKRRRDDALGSVIAVAEDMMYSRKLLNRINSRTNVISVISRSLFERSPRLKLHSYRVARLLRLFAEQMGYEEKEADQFFNLGLLHDIGMSSISDEILNKEGPLTDSEREQVRRHPEISYRILSAAPGLEEIARSSLYHHERWDGSGYPGRAKGGTIPVEARILAIADAYDRMKYGDSGRESLNSRQIRQKLSGGSGRQFDPDLMIRFLEQLPLLEQDPLS